MATKPTTRARVSTLRPSDIPGVFINRAGIHVNEDGVRISFKELQQRDKDRFTEVLGHEPATPADVLRGISMDPRVPMHVRQSAANQCASFYSPKLASTTIVGANGGPLDVRAQVGELSDAALAKLDKLISQGAALLGKAK